MNRRNDRKKYYQLHFAMLPHFLIHNLCAVIHKYRYSCAHVINAIREGELTERSILKQTNTSTSTPDT
ncbi:hypothetical protein TVAGG3_0501180 [Trichomonas vaginalis G3]|uniref:hypothetical protein n=1 Tax=Trichomonas vaginalis (strain ATCC PRA-98 / G3) TaxID=412133 RepID=UPI0021E5A8AE|nr:hypothetical protein TVAGG3_0501180 [Trichomonas vaginalis G3]KAI5517091.1 hypothetical protein TVAGG3_0501180 [Trichomonas vaginalis G3]